jgi:hypothetical protein
MSYRTFKDRQWQVRAPSSDPSCPPGTIVTFRGPRGNVMVYCGTATPYAAGAYDRASHTIGKANEYTISMDEPNRTITFTREGSFAGSWTADDKGAWPA